MFREKSQPLAVSEKGLVLTYFNPEWHAWVLFVRMKIFVSWQHPQGKLWMFPLGPQDEVIVEDITSCYWFEILKGHEWMSDAEKEAGMEDKEPVEAWV